MAYFQCHRSKDLSLPSLRIRNHRLSASLVRRPSLPPSNPNLKIFYTVDIPTKDWLGCKGYISKDMVVKGLPSPSDDTLVLVCGPPGMMDHVSGNKAKGYSRGEAVPRRPSAAVVECHGYGERERSKWRLKGVWSWLLWRRLPPFKTYAYIYLASATTAPSSCTVLPFYLFIFSSRYRNFKF